MATMTRRGSKRWQIQFQDLQGRRRSITLRCAYDAARDFKARLEKLLEHRRVGSALPPALAQWAAALDVTVRQKLAALDLVPAPENTSQGMTLGQWLKRWFASRSDLRGSTLTAYGHTRRDLLRFFGPDRPLGSITRGDAQDFHRWLKTCPRGRRKKPLAEATANRRLGAARTIFHAAVDHELIPRNPFAGIAATVRGNPKRMRFIDRETIQRVIDACPDAQWRLLVALARYGGLRIPSEAVVLTRQDVDLERGILRVKAPKTEHHPRHKERMVPLFPELRPFVLDVLEAMPPGETHLVWRYKHLAEDYEQEGFHTANLRTQFAKIIRRAGVEPWPKLWQNLRSSRETELAEHFPAHVVCYWIGNSEPVAREHYLQIHDEHFHRAAQQPTGPLSPGSAAPLRCCGAAEGPGIGQNRAEVAQDAGGPMSALFHDLPQPSQSQGLTGWALQDSNL